MNTVMEWATTESPCVVEVTTNCTCVYCPNCEVSNYGADLPDVCDDCKGDLQPMDNCYGDCYQFAVEDMAENIFPEAMARLGNPNNLIIEGRAMGWQRLSGHAIVASDWESFYQALTINGDFTLKFKLAGDTFSVRRYSHDEPVGAGFDILPFTALSDRMTIDEAIEKDIVDEYGCHKRCGDYFYDCTCE